MGHNDHIDFELLDLLDWACDEGYIDMEGEAYAIGQKVAHEEELTAEEQAIYDKEIGPLGEKYEEWDRANYMASVLAKDD